MREKYKELLYQAKKECVNLKWVNMKKKQFFGFIYLLKQDEIIKNIVRLRHMKNDKQKKERKKRE